MVTGRLVSGRFALAGRSGRELFSGCAAGVLPAGFVAPRFDSRLYGVPAGLAATTARSCQSPGFGVAATGGAP